MRLLVVADGVGGHRGGALAAQTIVELAGECFADLETVPSDPAGFLRDLCRQSNEAIRERSAGHGGQGFSTLVALLVTPRRAYWLHVGDSRLYCFRNGRLVHRTRDHSLVQALVDQGRIGEDEVRVHAQRNQLLRVLGMEDEVQPAQGQMSVAPCMAFFLCSDGFWDTIEPREALADMLDARHLPTSVSGWVAEAAHRGGPKGDNIGLAVWRSRPSGWLGRLPLPIGRCPT